MSCFCPVSVSCMHKCPPQLVLMITVRLIIKQCFIVDRYLEKGCVLTCFNLCIIGTLALRFASLRLRVICTVTRINGCGIATEKDKRLFFFLEDNRKSNFCFSRYEYLKKT